MMSRFLVLGSLALAGCATTPPLASNADVMRVEQEALPTPTRSDISLSTDVYALGAYDEIRIDVFGIPQLTELTIMIDGSGMISVPLVGPVRAAGRTSAELINDISVGLQRAKVRDPKVAVNLIEGHSNLFTIEGAVEKPGRYAVIGRMTLTRAIATAAGTAELAKTSEVVVLRTVKGQTYAGLYDLRNIRRGLYADPEIFVGDVILVDESKSRRLFRDFLQLAPLLTTPIIIALQ